jgi:hypothetical protein
MTDQPSQHEMARERWVANNYNSLLAMGRNAEAAAADVALNMSTPSLTVTPSDIPLIAERVKQRDDA